MHDIILTYMTENIDEHDQGLPSRHLLPPRLRERKKENARGLGLGHAAIVYRNQVDQAGLGRIPRELVLTVVGYPEDGILSGILPGNSSMLHGNEAISNELHLRLVNPLSDGVVSDARRPPHLFWLICVTK